jgi:hypothetical protein
LFTSLLTKAASAGIAAKVTAGTAALLVAGGGIAATAQAIEAPAPVVGEVSADSSMVSDEPAVNATEAVNNESGDGTTTGATTDPVTAGGTGDVTDSNTGATTDPVTAGGTGDVTDSNTGARTEDATTGPAGPVEVDEEEQAEAPHPDNHGAAVSEAAHGSYESGREHGAKVSSVARGDSGKGRGSDDAPETVDPPEAATLEAETVVETEHVEGATSGNDHRGQSGKAGKGGKG